MKLSEFIADYEAKRKPRDFLSIFYKDEKRNNQHISLRALSDRKRNLLMEADIEKAEIYETEYSDFSFTGRGHNGKCREWSAEINADQAKIALNIHPLLRAKPNKAKAGEERPKAKQTKAKPKQKKRRFTL